MAITTTMTTTAVSAGTIFTGTTVAAPGYLTNWVPPYGTAVPCNITYGPSSWTSSYPTSFYVSPKALVSNLSELETRLILELKEERVRVLYRIFKETAANLDLITYDKTSDNYITFVENDLDGKLITSTQLRDFLLPNRSLAVVALDTNLNRLEMSLVRNEEECRSNIENLLDDSLHVKEDKNEYFNSLTSRFLPLVNFSFCRLMCLTIRCI